MSINSNLLFQEPRPIKIEFDPNAVHSQSPEVANRLSRIADNYRLIDEMWPHIELVLEKQTASTSLLVPRPATVHPDTVRGGTIASVKVKRQTSRQSAYKPKPR